MITVNSRTITLHSGKATFVRPRNSHHTSHASGETQTTPSGLLVVGIEAVCCGHLSPRESSAGWLQSWERTNVCHHMGKMTSTRAIQ